MPSAGTTILALDAWAGGPAPGAGRLPQEVAAGTPLVVGGRGDVRAWPVVSPRRATTGGLGELPPVS